MEDGGETQEKSTWKTKTGNSKGKAATAAAAPVECSICINNSGSVPLHCKYTRISFIVVVDVKYSIEKVLCLVCFVLPLHTESDQVIHKFAKSN